MKKTPFKSPKKNSFISKIIQFISLSKYNTDNDYSIRDRYFIEMIEKEKADKNTRRTEIFKIIGLLIALLGFLTKYFPS
ncbi:hypothetical protein [Elizabethkingia ursingii]|uniref:hypothetical protein n=1 Tax=Elizabethkingia ursingii TaxID=1756150 RepID=UPI0007508C61|nr:hypothetical protein [Elizabethkingia ursingii]KUY29805.1 hypothetical protein ATB96_17755 [Elizabethkingia ursingii]